MKLHLTAKSFVVFDLDDTLYKEIEYLKSAFNEIAILIQNDIGLNLFHEMLSLFHQQEDVFCTIIKKYNINAYSKTNLIKIYREHYPNIKIDFTVQKILKKLNE